MTQINLLPWREMRRREQDRKVLTMAVGVWALMGLLVFYGHLHVTGLIEHQNERNAYLQTRIAELDEQIKEINELKKRKSDLIARMEVIQELQRNRTQIVHVFDDLVRKLPEGVYLTNLEKKGARITLKGLAQSNARVSTLMRNLDSSPWFTNPDLDVIDVRPREGSRISQFTLRVIQQGSEEDEIDKLARSVDEGGGSS